MMRKCRSLQSIDTKLIIGCDIVNARAMPLIDEYYRGFVEVVVIVVGYFEQNSIYPLKYRVHAMIRCSYCFKHYRIGTCTGNRRIIEAMHITCHTFMAYSIHIYILITVQFFAFIVHNDWRHGRTEAKPPAINNRSSVPDARINIIRIFYDW